ncbi:MAG: Cof-type HAD-IIB family hydrolase [Fimbriimonadaceae bacterium]
MSDGGSGARISLIALDLDGTTLTTERQIHPRNVDVIARATRAGVTIALASGRIRPSMAPFARHLGLGDGPLICSNGAHIVDASGATLYESHLALDEQNAILDFALREGLHVNGYTTERMYFLSDSAWLELYRTRARTIPTERVGIDSLRAERLIKLMIIAEPVRIRAIAAQGASLFNAERVAFTESEPEYLEFLPRDANKGAALERLAAHLGVDQGAVMAVGDYLNDVEMVAWAGFGVAMGNAVAEVKAVARLVVANNDEGGVADAVASVLQ